MSEQSDSVGYMMVIQKVTSMSGESIQVSTNLPRGATQDDFKVEIDKITGALEARMISENDKVLARTEATRKALGMDEVSE